VRFPNCPRRNRALSAVFLLVSLAVSSSFAAAPRPIVIRNVTLIDGRDAAAKGEMTVIISDRHFTTIAPAAKTEIPPDAEIIDAAGKFAIPGLWDMHVHLTMVGEVACPALIANGITGVRDMGGSLEIIDWMRRRIADETIPGPHIFRAGPFVDGSKPGVPDRLVIWNAEDGRKAVGYLQARGVDFIKVHNGAPPEAFFALLKEAAAKHIQVAGHIPIEVDPAAAIDAGYNSIEHIVSLFEGPVRKKVAQGSTQEAAMAEFTDEEARKLARLMVKRNAWFDPTLIMYWSIAHQADFKEHPDPRDRYTSKSAREFWKNVPDKPSTPEARKKMDEGFTRAVQITGILHSEKVRFLVGTDLAGRNIFPGFSVHDELALLVKAGLTPMETIIAATRHSAESLGKSDELGTIEPGKAADLVLLDQNPLEDISNTRKIRAVIANGRVFRRPELDAMLETAAKEAPSR
jgi:imidazolonepropionase-like amidohydrolase